MANITYSVIEKSCNKLFIGNLFGKVELYDYFGMVQIIMNLTDDNIRE